MFIREVKNKILIKYGNNKLRVSKLQPTKLVKTSKFSRSLQTIFLKNIARE